MFDEEPDGDPHGECALEIESLRAQIEELESVLRGAYRENEELRERLNILESTPS